MKMLVRVLLSSVAIFVFTLAAHTTVHTQVRIEDRFAKPAGVRLC